MTVLRVLSGMSDAWLQACSCRNSEEPKSCIAKEALRQQLQVYMLCTLYSALLWKQEEFPVLLTSAHDTATHTCLLTRPTP
jgi:hypothetical protein